MTISRMLGLTLAVSLCAGVVVFAHNHSSGDPAPSPEDQEITPATY
jgi:DNA repair protein RadC